MKHQRYDDDDAAFDGGILRDGHSVRVRVSMRDSADDTPARRARVTDAGGDGWLGLHRPGFRVAAPGQSADYVADARAALYRSYDEQKAREFMDQDEPPRRRRRKWQQRDPEGREAGTDEVEDGTLDARDRAYADYENSLTAAWRQPPPVTPSGFGGYENTPPVGFGSNGPRPFDPDDPGDQEEPEDDDEELGGGLPRQVKGWRWRQRPRRYAAVPGERSAKPKDSMTVDELARDHQATMHRLYARLDSELIDAWRHPQ